MHSPRDKARRAQENGAVGREGCHCEVHVLNASWRWAFLAGNCATLPDVSSLKNEKPTSMALVLSLEQVIATIDLMGRDPAVYPSMINAAQSLGELFSCKFQSASSMSLIDCYIIQGCIVGRDIEPQKTCCMVSPSAGFHADYTTKIMLKTRLKTFITDAWYSAVSV